MISSNASFADWADTQVMTTLLTSSFQDLPTDACNYVVEKLVKGDRRVRLGPHSAELTVIVRLDQPGFWSTRQMVQMDNQQLIIATIHENAW